MGGGVQTRKSGLGTLDALLEEVGNRRRPARIGCGKGIGVVAVQVSGSEPAKETALGRRKTLHQLRAGGIVGSEGVKLVYQAGRGSHARPGSKRQYRGHLLRDAVLFLRGGYRLLIGI